MKIVLDDEVIIVTPEVIATVVREETDKQLQKYQSLELPQRLLVKGGIRTAIAMCEQFFKVKIPLPDTPAYKEDFIVAFLSDIPTLVADLSNYITIYAKGVGDLANHTKALNEINMEFAK